MFFKLALLLPGATLLLATAPLASSADCVSGWSSSTLQQLTFFNSAKEDHASSCTTQHDTAQRQVKLKLVHTQHSEH
jgi:hypothetical protein